MATKMVANFVSKIDRKTTCSISFEHIVDDEHDAEQAGLKDAKLFLAYTTGFGSAPVRRY